MSFGDVLIFRVFCVSRISDYFNWFFFGLWIFRGFEYCLYILFFRCVGGLVGILFVECFVWVVLGFCRGYSGLVSKRRLDWSSRFYLFIDGD